MQNYITLHCSPPWSRASNLKPRIIKGRTPYHRLPNLLPNSPQVKHISRNARHR
uniref:Uncharacterized protein n=1 Tax=Arundo donax TaxID=35708 RepID=A0A0A8YR60_ARUDO